MDNNYLPDAEVTGRTGKLYESDQNIEKVLIKYDIQKELEKGLLLVNEINFLSKPLHSNSLLIHYIKNVGLDNTEKTNSFLAAKLQEIINQISKDIEKLKECDTSSEPKIEDLAY